MGALDRDRDGERRTRRGTPLQVVTVARTEEIQLGLLLGGREYSPNRLVRVATSRTWHAWPAVRSGLPNMGRSIVSVASVIGA